MAGEQGWPRVPRGEQGTLKEYQQGWETSKAGNQQAGFLICGILAGGEQAA